MTHATIVQAVRGYWAQRGWRIFLSDKERWWATTTRRPVLIGTDWTPRHTVLAADAVDADTYTELAAAIEGRTA
jgi:hypothetical protein